MEMVNRLKRLQTDPRAEGHHVYLVNVYVETKSSLSSYCDCLLTLCYSFNRLSLA